MDTKKLDWFVKDALDRGFSYLQIQRTFEREIELLKNKIYEIKELRRKDIHIEYEDEFFLVTAPRNERSCYMDKGFVHSGKRRFREIRQKVTYVKRK